MNEYLNKKVIFHQLLETRFQKSSDIAYLRFYFTNFIDFGK